MPDERLFTKSFQLLTLGHFLQALGYSSMLLLPLYLGHLGASRAQMGWIMASASVGSLCMRPLVGWGLDAWGRKPMLLLGTALLSIGMGLLYFVVEIGFFIYFVRILSGIGIGILFTGYFTFAADIIPISRRTEGLAIFGVSGLVPLFVNPLSGSLGISGPDLRWFFPLLGLVIVASMFSLFPLKEDRSGSHQKSFKVKEALASLVKPPLWPVWLATVVFSGLVATMMTFATVCAKSRGMTQPTSLWMTYAFGAILVRVLGARILDRVGTSNIVAPALGVYGFAMLLASMASTKEAFLLLGLLGGIGHGICFPVLTSQVVSRVPQSFRGSGLSMFTALWGLSEILLSPALGRFADIHGDAAMFSFAAAATSILLVFWAIGEHTLAGNA